MRMTTSPSRRQVAAWLTAGAALAARQARAAPGRHIIILRQ